MDSKMTDGCRDVPGLLEFSFTDIDDDGVPDIMDRCPTQSETWNRYMDYDGCPDILPTIRSKT